MRFVPAIEWPGQASPQHWHLAFVDGQLLLPEPEGSELQPLADAAWRHAAEAVHYLGRLDGADCWALQLPQAPAGWRRVPLRAAMMGLPEALAGFVEAGESIEQCIRREVAEEVGVEVGRLHYYGSQSWPFPNSLMIAFSAEWTGGEIVPQPDEIEHAQWFDFDALPRIPPRFSISGHLIRDTIDALRSKS